MSRMVMRELKTGTLGHRRQLDPRMRGRRASSPRAAERDGACVTAARCVGRGLGLGGTGTGQYLASSVAPSRPATTAASGSPLVRPATLIGTVWPASQASCSSIVAVSSPVAAAVP